MAIRAPLVLGDDGLPQRLQQGDYLSSTVNGVLRGQVPLVTTGAFKRFTVSDPLIKVGMVLVISSQGLTAPQGLVCVINLQDQRAGSFDLSVLVHYIDGRPLTANTQLLLKLNYIGV